MSKNIYISIGWRCESAVRRSELYNLKKPNYQTCVFDLMISNLTGVILCIQDNFKHFCSTKYLKYDGKNYITNTYYKFRFNHETPGHSDLHLKEKWPGNDKNYFIKNNFKEFIERYKRRINNFLNYVRENNTIVFILQRPNLEKKEDPLLELLKETLKKKYPNKNFKFDLFEETKLELLKHELTMSGLNKRQFNLNFYKNPNK